MELNQYLDVFIEESKEHLLAINNNIIALEKTPHEISIVNEIFRSAHTLKGMSATMGFEDLAQLTHVMENVLDGIRNETIEVSSNVLDVLFSCLDHLEAMVLDISNGGDGKRNVTETVARLAAIENGEGEAAPINANNDDNGREQELAIDSFEKTVLLESIDQGYNAFYTIIRLRDDCILKAARVFMVFEVLEQVGEVVKSVPSVEMLEQEEFESEFQVTVITKTSSEELIDRILRVSEITNVDVHPITRELLKSVDEETPGSTETKANEEQQEANLTAEKTDHAKEAMSGQKGQTTVTSKTIRVNIDRLDQLMNLFEELVIDRGRLEDIAKDLRNSELNETVEHMARISSDLQGIILTMRMVPVEQVFNRFPRMVRGLAKELNKSINLEIIGQETELDRTVIDEIGDPLVHLLRNSIDHGIELPDVRKKKGKTEEGTITLRAYHSGNHVFIEIEDDGAGINREKVLKKAIENGIVSKEMSLSMTDKQIDELLFASGFSTADHISDISGRGVGLDVVKSKIESLGGQVAVESTPGVGTVFSIQLPLTLSIIPSLLVEVQQEKYAIPLSSIIETAVIKKEEILSAHHQKVIDFRGKVVPLIFLKDIFEVPVVSEKDRFYPVVVVRKGEKMAGLVVDSFIGQQEIVLKSLGSYLTSVFAISGATILGDGQVALIIDCNALIQ
ncbi:chemotaxis protein CheA [Fictibacillus sp. Mic-4]|uniref:chemotaxis protein CheW n=1 Tax=Fictibacillus sp. Mic-4 TaxID=3132826 RepID=UPI003CE78D02